MGWIWEFMEETAGNAKGAEG
ncbi:MAG: hypothetical protein JWP27_1856, partial [Flaviaesturariibacter sp.]|nr:hypothetical protein [Flaviaesturariibacter sp.]